MSARTSLARKPSSERLAVRRRRRRQRVLIAWFLLLIALISASVYGLWQPAVRVSEVTIYGADQSLATLATTAMHGTTLGIPNDSIFLVPKTRIRAAILADHPDIAAVSIFRTGFNAISIRIDDRVALATWCGLAPVEGVQPYCYLFDSSGFIFSALPEASDALASTTVARVAPETLNHFTLYAPLASETLEPLRARIAHAEKFPSVFDFARQMNAFGVSVDSVVITGDEVQFIFTTSTPDSVAPYLTYVLGEESAAYTALTSARGSFNLKDGSISYIDLRFPGKVYIKRVDSADE